MHAHINNTTIAESDNTIEIEGNQYFPPESVDKQYLEDSDTPYTCPWKGETQYFHITIDESTYEDAAWGYPDPKDGATDRVGSDFSGYVAFDADAVTVERR
jgi:uncharacterized protein (DUF427 family)